MGRVRAHCLQSSQAHMGNAVLAKGLRTEGVPRNTLGYGNTCLLLLPDIFNGLKINYNYEK